MSDMQCLLIFPKAQPVTLLYDSNTLLPPISGIRLGPALQLEVQSTAIDWSTVKQGSAASAEVYTAEYNGAAVNATQRSVMLPVGIKWVAAETLLDGAFVFLGGGVEGGLWRVMCMGWLCIGTEYMSILHLYPSTPTFSPMHTYFSTMHTYIIPPIHTAVPMQLSLPVYSSPRTNGSVVVEQGSVSNSSLGPLEVVVVQGNTQETTVSGVGKRCLSVWGQGNVKGLLCGDEGMSRDCCGTVLL